MHSAYPGMYGLKIYGEGVTSPTFELRQILFIDSTAHVLVVLFMLMLMAIAAARDAVGGMMAAVGIRLNAGIVG